MSNRDIIFSVILHVAIIVATIISVPIVDQKRPMAFDEVIRVQLAAPQATPAITPKPVAVPEPELEEEPDVPVTPPEVKEEEAVIDPEPEPEEKEPDPQPEEKPEPQQQTTQQPAESQRPAEGESEGGGVTEGDVDAPVGEGSPFAGATIDNASFDYPYWFTQTFNKISANWRNRVQYSRPLVCVVYFQVIKSGRVIDLRVEESSGVQEFDDGCLQAIGRAAPFPPLPRSFVDEIIGITLPFKYDPR